VWNKSQVTQQRKNSERKRAPTAGPGHRTWQTKTVRVTPATFIGGALDACRCPRLNCATEEPRNGCWPYNTRNNVARRRKILDGENLIVVGKRMVNTAFRNSWTGGSFASLRSSLLTGDLKRTQEYGTGKYLAVCPGTAICCTQWSKRVSLMNKGAGQDRGG